MTFHDHVDKEKYSQNTIHKFSVTFFDSTGNEVLTDSGFIRPYDGAAFATSDATTKAQEYMVAQKVMEKFRDALFRLGVVKPRAAS